MIEDAPSRPLSPSEYAIYLESMSNDDFWKHAKALAAHSTRPMQESLPPIALPATTLTFVTCLLRDGASCILPFNIIREILPISQHITRLPDVPPWMIGILSWRGETMAAIDLCAYITQKELPHPRERITLITRYENTWLALCVPGINGTPTEVDLGQVIAFSPPLISDNEDATSALRGVDGTLEIEDITHQKPLVPDISLLFKDIMQRIESRDTHV